MRYYFSFVSVASVVIAGILTPFLTERLAHVASALLGRKPDLLATPVGNAILFALVFVVAWCGVSLVLAIPWLLARSHTS